MCGFLMVGNGYVSVSEHICPFCEREFTCEPAQRQAYDALCLADDCISYDPARDAEITLCGKKPVRTDN